jgi:parvulin-like peptidyl-prolyl isomerase
MRHWSFPAALVFALGAPAAIAAPAPQLAPAVLVATVNGTPIPRSAYDRVLTRLKQRYAERFGIDFDTDHGKAIETEMRASIMAQLVERQLIKNEATRLKLTVSPDQVDAKIAELKKELPEGQPFEEALKEHHMTLEDLRTEVGDGILIQSVADALTQGIGATDEQVAAYYQAHQAEYDRPEEVRVRHILVKEKAKAEQLLNQLKQGANFEALAREHSEDPGSKGEGGDLGFFAKGRMVPEFETEAFRLKPGELSGLVQTQFGFHILQGVEHRDARRVPLDEVKTEIKDKLSREARDAKLAAWMDEQKKQAAVVYAPGFDPKPVATPTPKPTVKPTVKPKAKAPAKPKAKPKPRATPKRQ